ncbi:MAG: sulfatase-like hydrolase/transferase, partial [Planctomycetes bacterium]|nr:sulfatase-like hydrolase/transferase [Planctomycetota bacterium]
MTGSATVWRFVLAATACLVSCGPSGASGAEKGERRPNVVFFLVDDMGWMDSTVYGSQYYDTPNMHRLAERSMVFTDAYAANPLCSP